jgi:transposase InsO family protein
MFPLALTRISFRPSWAIGAMNDACRSSATVVAGFQLAEVWIWRGLVTYYTVFVIDLASRRVQIVASTPSPDDTFMRQVGCTLTAADEGALVGHRVLICDRDRKWSLSVRQRLEESGVRVVQTQFQAPNANAYAERFGDRSSTSV